MYSVLWSLGVEWLLDRADWATLATFQGHSSWILSATFPYLLCFSRSWTTSRSFWPLELVSLWCWCWVTDISECRVFVNLFLQILKYRRVHHDRLLLHHKVDALPKISQRTKIKLFISRLAWCKIWLDLSRRRFGLSKHRRMSTSSGQHPQPRMEVRVITALWKIMRLTSLLVFYSKQDSDERISRLTWTCNTAGFIVISCFQQWGHGQCRLLMMSKNRKDCCVHGVAKSCLDMYPLESILIHSTLASKDLTLLV
jgi:hypothetical protein